MKNFSLIKALCFGVMRNFHKLNFIVNLLLKSNLKTNEYIVKSLLWIGLFQLQYTRVPEYAIIDETVQAAKGLNKMWAVPLINALLRNYLRNKKYILEKCKTNISANYSHPIWLIKKLPIYCKYLIVRPPYFMFR